MKSRARALSPVGHVLRDWRRVRGKSQLRLAHDADVSARHLSFIETGRAQPSRRILLTLARSLEMPLRGQNSLLEAAGYARLYKESQFDAGELAQVRGVIEFLLQRHDPYSAVALDRCWNVLLSNRAFDLTVARLVDLESIFGVGDTNLMKLLFHPDGLRRNVANMDQVGPIMLNRIRGEIRRTGGPDPLEELLEELVEYPGIPALWKIPDPSVADSVVIPVHLVVGGEDLRFLSAITTLGTPQDVMLQELSIETFLPADDATDRFMQGVGAEIDDS